MTDPEVDLVDRCAAAVWHEWTGRRWDDIDEVNRKLSRSVARRVLAEAGRGAKETAETLEVRPVPASFIGASS